MIRPYRPQDIEPLLSLWLESTTRAHPFIDPEYWRESAALVSGRYLPQSQTWVCDMGGRLVGFISVLEQRFIGGLFVHHSRHGDGVGAALMAQAQSRFPLLSLEVYEKNHRACAFYRKQGFVVVERSFSADTQETILIMQWVKTA